MTYGFAKLNGAQFTVLDSQLATPLGDADPFWLAWYFFGYSDLYKGFIALTEIVGGVLAAGILAFAATYWIANYNNRRPTAIDGTWEVVGDRNAGISRAFFERNRACMVVFMNEEGVLDRRHFEIADGEIRIWDQWLSKGDLVAQGRLTERDLMKLRFEAGLRTTLRRRFGPGLRAAPRATR